MEKFKSCDNKLKCIFCNTFILNKNSITNHLVSKTHITNEQNSFYCKECSYATKNEDMYKKHLLTQTHQKFIRKYTKTVVPNKGGENKTPNSVRKYTTMLKELKEIKDKLNKLENNNIDETKIRQVIRESVDTSKLAKTSSVLFNKLNQFHINTPPLLTLTENDTHYLLTDQFNPKKREDPDAVEKTVIRAYKNKILVNELVNLIISQVKHNDTTKQGVFVSDTSRLTYIVKLTMKEWLSDKKGIRFTERVIKPIIETLENRIREYLFNLDEDDFTDFIEFKEYETVVFDLLQEIKSNKLQEDILFAISPLLQYTSPLSIDLNTEDSEQKPLEQKNKNSRKKSTEHSN